MIRRFLRRVADKITDLRIELNLTVIDFCQSRVKTFKRRKLNRSKKG